MENAYSETNPGRVIALGQIAGGFLRCQRGLRTGRDQRPLEQISARCERRSLIIFAHHSEPYDPGPIVLVSPRAPSSSTTCSAGAFRSLRTSLSMSRELGFFLRDDRARPCQRAREFDPRAQATEHRSSGAGARVSVASGSSGSAGRPRCIRAQPANIEPVKSKNQIIGEKNPCKMRPTRVALRTNPTFEYGGLVIALAGL
jgi:hypothetical protein